MRTLLLGTDFVYNSLGQLTPIEINTNVGIDKYFVEDIEDVFNLELLRIFIIDNNFTKLTYIGGINFLSTKLENLCELLKIEYNFLFVNKGLNIPYVEDNEYHLIIRSAYDITAIVDEEYCKNKINFLELIKYQTFSSQFAYINDGLLINNITTIKNNGNHPNFILKSIFPKYDQNVYPKFFKVNDQSELDIVLQNLTYGYFLMEYHLNLNKLYENHIVIYRNLSLLFPPNLNSMPIGSYKKISIKNIDELSIFDVNTFEILQNDRVKYFTKEGGINRPKLLDTDQVEMADGSFKTGEDLAVGDYVKTIDIPNLNNITENITYDEFISGTTCSSNKIIYKFRVDKLVDYVTITFTDGTTWEDTKNSSYLIVRDNIVMFKYLDVEDLKDGIKIGDKIILISSCDKDMVSVLKEISSSIITKQFFGGWEITVETEHLFLTKSEESNLSYVAIEHNYTPCYGAQDCTNWSAECGKPHCCCEGQCVTCG